MVPMAEWKHQHVAGHEEVRDIIGSLPLRQEMWPAEGTDLILFRLSMNRTGIKGCFLCGNPADDADDLVPPEVLYRGSSDRNYKMPPIIKVAACKAHCDCGQSWMVARSCCGFVAAGSVIVVSNQKFVSR